MTPRSSADDRSTLLLALLIVPLSGCAVRYYDRASGTEHVWGFSHVAVRVQPRNEDVRAIATQIDVLGAAAERARDGTGVTLGWRRVSRIEVVDANASVRFDWPSAQLFDVRVGTLPPPALRAHQPQPQSQSASTDSPLKE